MNPIRYDESEWRDLSDRPEQFVEAIRNATSHNERVFFETLMYKIINEFAGSNEVLMHNEDNEDGIYILRVCTEDFLIGSVADRMAGEVEYGGLFYFLRSSMEPYIHRDVTVLQWLRARDYKGIRYDRNNDLI